MHLLMLKSAQKNSMKDELEVLLYVLLDGASKIFF